MTRNRKPEPSALDELPGLLILAMITIMLIAAVLAVSGGAV